MIFAVFKHSYSLLSSNKALVARTSGAQTALSTIPKKNSREESFLISQKKSLTFFISDKHSLTESFFSLIMLTTESQIFSKIWGYRIPLI